MTDATTSSAPVIDEGQVSRDFLAARAIAARGDPAASLDALLPNGRSAPGAPPAQTPAQAPSPDATVPLGVQLDRVLATPAPQSEPTLTDRMRALVAGEPGEIVGDVLPFAKDQQTGALRLAIPEGARQAMRGIADLLDYTHAGGLPVGQDISPDAKAALMLLGGIKSPAAGTGAGIARAASEGAAAAGENIVPIRGAAAMGAEGARAGATGKAAGAAPPVAPASPAEGAAAATAPAPAFQLAGQEGKALVVTPAIRAQATDYLNGVTGDNPVQASLARIADPKVMDQAIQGVASFIERADVKPDELLRMGANAIGMRAEDAQGILAGKLPNDEQIAAWAMLVNSGAKELGDLAQKAVTSGAPEDWEAAVRAYALQNHILEQWTGAGTEQGRAFRARQLASEARGDYTKTLQDIIQNAGADNIETAIRKIASLPTPEQQGALVGALRWMGSRDGLLYGWYNYLLTIKTVGAKLTTDALMPVWNLAERYAAEKFGASSGKPGGVAPGETMALLSGYVGAFGDAVRAGGRALLAGESRFMSEYQTMDGLAKTRLSLLANGSPEILPPTMPTLGALNFIKMALPTSWIAGVSDFAKVFNYRAEARSLAYRRASRDGLTGEDLGARVNDLVNVLPRDLHEQAVTRAVRNTFEEPLTGVAAALTDAADQFNIPVRGTNFEIPMGRILLPFARTPVNFVRFMYRASPLPLAIPSAAFKAETAFPGAERDLAYARIGLGTGLAITTAGLAMGGYITGNGPSSPELRRAWIAAGNQPYSIQIPGWRPVSYPVEPFGLHIGAVADTVDLMKFAKAEDNDQLALSVGLGIGRAFLSRTYMSSLAQFMEAVQHPDAQGSRWADQLATSLTVPRTVSDFAGAVDPWQRAHYSFMQTVESRIPFLSQSLPHARTIWGDPIPLKDAYLPAFSGSGAAHMLSKITLGPDPANAEPIDKWIWDNRMAFPEGPEGRLGISKPGLTQRFDAPGGRLSARVDLDPEVHDRFQELAGNEALDTRSRLGAKDTLNALVQGSHPDAAMQRQWDNGAPALQAKMVLATIAHFREQAKRQLLGEYPALQDTVAQGWAQQRQKLTAGPASATAAPRMPTIQ
ncbi:MAG TPA: hypothetical protein VF930_05835 [Stellaceae bacterium]